MRINLGCSDAHLAGFLNVDIVPPADALMDLSQPWLWPDNYADEIVAHDIIEHLPDKVLTMNEAWRVLKPRGRFDIEVPIAPGAGAWCDPGHVSVWTASDFEYYEHGNYAKDRWNGSNGVKCAFRVVSIKKHSYQAKWDEILKLHIVLEAVK